LINFHQSPQQKLDYIQLLQRQGHKVMMIGDGLNDAGALKQSDTGIAVSDNINNFSPACDAVLEGRSFHLLPQFIALAKDGAKIIRWNLLIAASYNALGLYFAVQGNLKPLIAALLMPLSTLTILSFSRLTTSFFTTKHRLR
jgi:Cu+-exporting ATPase